jgi:hypothetical protein
LHLDPPILLYTKTVIKTPENNTKFMILKTLHAKSCDLKPLGAISKKHSHTPVAQNVLMSSAERRLIILNIKGRLKNGSNTAAIIAIL